MTQQPDLAPRHSVPSSPDWWAVLEAMEARAEATGDLILCLVTEELWDALHMYFGFPASFMAGPEDERRWNRAQAIMLTWLMQQAAL